MRIIRAQIDTAISALREIFGAQTLPRRAALSCQTSAAAPPTMQALALCIDTSSKARRRCCRWTRWDARSARADLALCTRTLAISTVLRAGHRIDTSTPTQELTDRTAASAFLTDPTHRTDLTTRPTMLAIRAFIHTRPLTKIRQIRRTC